MLKNYTIIGLLVMMSLSLSAQTNDTISAAISVADTTTLPAAYISASSPIYSKTIPSYSTASSISDASDASDASDVNPLDVGIRYNIELAGDITYNPTLVAEPFTTLPYHSGGCSLGIGVGLQMNQFFYLGAGIDLTGEWGKTTLRENDEAEYPVRLSNWVSPIYADARAYWANQSICTPFLDVQIGGYIGLASRVVTDYPEPGADQQLACYIPKDGFYFSTGLGMNISMVTLSLGYKLYHQPGYNNNYAYFKVGVSIFKPVNLYYKR